LFLFNTLFGILIALIISSLSGTIKDAGPLAQNVANVALKTGNELNMINTLSSTVGDLGLVGTKFI